MEDGHRSRSATEIPARGRGCPLSQAGREPPFRSTAGRACNRARSAKPHNDAAGRPGGSRRPRSGRRNHCRTDSCCSRATTGDRRSACRRTFGNPGYSRRRPIRQIRTGSQPSASNWAMRYPRFERMRICGSRTPDLPSPLTRDDRHGRRNPTLVSRVRAVKHRVPRDPGARARTQS
jgi:hypothetical protein